MAYSRLAAIARRSYFDPEEDDHDADNETAELFAASNQGVRAASGKGGHLNGNGEASDTLFQQVRLGAAGGLPSTPSSGQNGPAQGARPKTAADSTEGGEGGGQVKKGDTEPDEYGDAGIHQAVPITGSLHTTARAEGETSKGQVSTPKTDVAGLTVTEAAGATHRADKTLGQHSGTRGGRRSLSSSCKTDVDAASKAEAETDQYSGDVSPFGLPATVRPSSSQQRLFTMDDFAERPLSRSGGSSTRRLSPYREPQAGGQEPHLSASGSSKQGIREGTSQPKTQGEDKGTHRSVANTSASAPLEDQGTCYRPRIAGRRHDEPQAQYDRIGSSMSSQPSQGAGPLRGEVSGGQGRRPLTTEDMSTLSVAEGLIAKTTNQFVARSEEHKTLSVTNEHGSRTLSVTNEHGSRQEPALEVGTPKTGSGAAPRPEAASTSATDHQASGDKVGFADKQPLAAVASQAPLSIVQGMTAGRAVDEAGPDAMAAKAGPLQAQSSTLSSSLNAASRAKPPPHPSLQQQGASEIATQADAAATNALQVVEVTSIQEKIFEKEPDACRASVDMGASTKASSQPGSHFRPPSIQTAAEKKPLKAVCGPTASAKCGAKAGGGSVAAHDTGDMLESTAIPITTSKSPIVGQCKGIPAAVAVDPADAYALVPMDMEGGNAYQYQAPNFVLVGEPHSQFDVSTRPEGEGEDRAVEDYELIGREPMIAVTSQKSLFELLQKQTEAEAAAQRRLQEEEQALQQQEWDRQQLSEQQAYAGTNTGTWDDRLHYGADPSHNEGQYGSQPQWQQSSQGGGDACAECLHHQEDLPPAHYAAAVGHFACLQALCTQDAYSLMSFDGANRSTLFYASANERTDCCEFLIDWYSPLINLADTNGDTPLHAAASSGSEACLYLLLHKGKALMDTQNRMGMTPPHLAKNASILRVLFEAGAQMAIQDRHGRTPLYLACAMNRTECAAYLCEIADLDQLALADRRGDTPLHAAAFHGNNECLLLLLQFGAPPTTPNIKGLTAIDLARNKGHMACLKVLQEYHLHHSTNFDSVLFLATVEGHNAVKQQQEGETIQAQASEHQALQSKKSICLKHYKEWLAYEYEDGRTFWYNSRTGHSQWEQPPELVMSPTAHRQLSSKDPSTITKLKEVGDWIKYSNTKTQSFYYNQQSGDFQWTQPPEFGHATSSSTSTTEGAQAPAQEVRGWQVYCDPSTSKTFFYNPVTQVSSWEPPPDGEVGGAWVPEQEEEAKQVNEMSDLGV